VIAYGSVVAIGATLTLPGLAGLLLSAGLAIDANVLVFERAREEFHAQRQPRLISALDRGFSKALSAITDSNTTTVLAAALLFLLASGPVRGFGVTLTIGVIASIVSALLVTRVLTDFAVQRNAFAKRPRLTGIGFVGRVRTWLESSGIDLMKRAGLWLGLSGAVLVLAFGGMLLRGFNFGVEFTGGRVIEYSSSERISIADARAAVTEAGFPTAVVQESGTAGRDPNISVRIASRDDDDERAIRAALSEVGGTVSPENDQIIGPTLGSELRNRALIALVIALAAQLLYLAIRFRWTFATAAVIAIFHDVLIVLGVFAWLGKPIDGIFLASALTIIGVSVNDTIITLDRVRERWAGNRTGTLPGIVNTAILETAPRTINTSISTVFILGSLLFLGGAVAGGLLAGAAARPDHRHLLVGVRRLPAGAVAGEVQRLAAADAEEGRRLPPLRG
jgi:SecD/SecF fusion protein